MPELNARTYVLATYFLPACVLTCIVFICFGRTLGSYFVADDFGQICYVAGICKGNLSELISNFTGAYMQIPVMQIYRPCLLLSFIFDYLIWHTNAFGYFLTNILFLIGTAIMLYLLLRKLTRYWGNNRSLLFSFLSAALFASSPLHCESISFVSGRDNIISAFFYLLALYCFVSKSNTKNNKLLLVGIVSFWIAVLSKETAIGLPLILAGLSFFLPHIFNQQPEATSALTHNADRYSIQERLRLAFIVSLPLWFSTIIYFLIRFLALGTFTGGYTGSIGAGLMSNLVKRWTTLDTIFKIIFPLNLEVFGAASDYKTILSISYIILATLIFIKLLSSKWPSNWLGLMILWVLTTIVPLYQVWALGNSLEGARFFFFLTIPLAIIVPLLITAPSNNSHISTNTSKTMLQAELRIIEILAVVTTGILVLVSINITQKNNIPWVHAGKQTEACLLAGQKLAKLTDPGKKLVLLGLPSEKEGAHIIYNGPTFNVMMSPPFCEMDYGTKFITFEPLFYGFTELINTQRFKEVLSDPSIVGLFVWNENTLTFDQLPMPSNQVLTGLPLSRPMIFKKNDILIASLTSTMWVKEGKAHQVLTDDYGLLNAASNLDPYQYDFIEFTLKALLPKEPIFIFWKGERTLNWCDYKHPVHTVGCNASSTTNIRIRLSDHWRWFTQGNITQLQLEFMPGQSIEINNMRLISAKELIPKINIANAPVNNLGVYAIGKDGAWVDFDAGTIRNCKAIQIEISKPNYFLDGLPEKETKNAIMTTIVHPSVKGRLHISSNTFISPAYYQLSALCLDQSGTPVSERSDPITVSFNN